MHRLASRSSGAEMSHTCTLTVRRCILWYAALRFVYCNAGSVWLHSGIKGALSPNTAVAAIAENRSKMKCVGALLLIALLSTAMAAPLSK